MVVHALEGAPGNAPVVATHGRDVTLDGAKVAQVDAAKKTPRVDELLRALRARTPASGTIACTFEQEAPWNQVRSVVATAAQAGYPRAAFLTRLQTGPSYLNLDVQKSAEKRELHVSLSSRGAVMLKWMEGSKAITDVVSTDAAVARMTPAVQRGWVDHGLHHDPNDRRLDQAVLHVDPETPYALVIAVLDGISGVRRKLVVDGKEASVPAFSVNVDPSQP